MGLELLYLLLSSGLTHLQAALGKGFSRALAWASPHCHTLLISRGGKVFSKTADLEHQELEGPEARVRRWRVWK